MLRHRILGQICVTHFYEHSLKCHLITTEGSICVNLLYQFDLHCINNVWKTTFQSHLCVFFVLQTRFLHYFRVSMHCISIIVSTISVMLVMQFNLLSLYQHQSTQLLHHVYIFQVVDDHHFYIMFTSFSLKKIIIRKTYLKLI